MALATLLAFAFPIEATLKAFRYAFIPRAFGCVGDFVLGEIKCVRV
jgi:hypothetical protein